MTKLISLPFRHGLVGAVVLAVCAAQAQTTSGSPAQDKTQKGAGAAQLQPTTSGASESMLQGSMSTESFIKEASMGNLAEIAMAELAQSKSEHPQTKQLAGTIGRDHQQAQQQLRTVAQAHNVTLQQSLDKKHQAKLSKLQNLSGSEFDQAYVKEMLRDHQKDIAEYERAVRQSQNSDVMQYAETTLPVLRKHVQHSKQTAQAVGIDAATIASILKETPKATGGTEDTMETGAGAGASPGYNTNRITEP